MNIAEAKEQIRKTCIAYLTRDEFGDYTVPVEAQRPIFLVGAPGIGKTAIMAQVADELGLGLVDYSMTHHTRQSAIGLPYIDKREYGGASVPVSEYTMSEIIASVHECIAKTGRSEGILFLDEINCVSETLAPAMLRFLQSKTFGTHRVPEGWIVASAGNPAEYNKSARAFDIATLDRVKRINVEPDINAWRTYAIEAGVHPAVLGYLDLKPDDFYRIETKGRERNFVTARGWMDLSTMCRLYDVHGLDIDAPLVEQYVQVPTIAADFVAYLELFAAYARDYHIADILDGTEDTSLSERAAQAGLDERMALCGLLADGVAARAAEVHVVQEELLLVRTAIVNAKEREVCNSESLAEALSARADALEQQLTTRSLHFRSNTDDRKAHQGAIRTLRTFAARSAGQSDADALAAVGNAFNELLAAHSEQATNASAALGHALTFSARAFGEGSELIMLLGELTLNSRITNLVQMYGCPEYFEFSKLLNLEARKQGLQTRLDMLNEELQAKS